MYHFHGLRLLPGRRARLFKFYKVGRAGLAIYRQYLRALSESYATLDATGISVPCHALPPERLGWLKGLLRRFEQAERFESIPMQAGTPSRIGAPVNARS
jgi:hypothetical protein